MSGRQYKSFAEFWPYYIAEHSKPTTRALHAIGTSAGLVLMVAMIAIGKWWLFPLGLVVGYAFAWVGHFFVEKNRLDLTLETLCARTQKIARQIQAPGVTLPGQ